MAPVRAGDILSSTAQRRVIIMTLCNVRCKTHMLSYSLAEELYPMKKLYEIVDGGRIGGRIDTGMPKGSQAVNEAPDLRVINAATFECRIERREARRRGRDGDSILRRHFRQVDF